MTKKVEVGAIVPPLERGDEPAPTTSSANPIEVDHYWENIDGVDITDEGSIASRADDLQLLPVAANALKEWQDRKFPLPSKQHRHKGKRKKIRDIDTHAGRYQAAREVREIGRAAFAGDLGPAEAY